MDRKDERYNLIMSLGGAVLLWAVLALLFDFYYDLNDDVLIKDIIAGIYTGTPDAHNNQMLYPISLLYAGLYRITDKIPWFGLTEIILLMASFVIMAYRICAMIRKLQYKIIYVFTQMIVFGGLMMWELVNVQYTVVAGILTAAAAVWMYTGAPVGSSEETAVGLHRDKWGRIFRIKETEDRNIDRDNTIPKVYKKATYREIGTFIKGNLPAIILITIAFNIRSELVLLLSPLLAATAISKWIDEDHSFDPLVVCGYLGVFLSVCMLMLASLSVDAIAYGSPEWKEYRRFFDARTDVYDFTGVPDYEENKGFYDKAGISEEQVNLLTDYNYYLDDSIDADMLETIAEGVKSGKAVGRRTFRKTIREALWEYVHNAIRVMSTNPGNSIEHIFADEAGQHTGFNLVVIILYLAIIIMGILKKDASVAVKVLAFLIMRSIPWIYVYLQGRVLSRITHPLYILEIMVLISILTRQAAPKGNMTGADRMVRAFAFAVAGFTVIISAVMLPARYNYIKASAEERAAANTEYAKILDTVISHPDTYYYVDTYSTVDATEKIFGQHLISKKNMQLLGGWMGNSPLDKAKQNAYDKSEVILTNTD